MHLQKKRDNEQAEGDQSNRKIYGTPHFYYKDGDGDKDGSYAPYALGGSLSLNEDFYNNFHVFGINWTPDKIEWYVDGIVYNTMNLSGDERLEAAAACFNKPSIYSVEFSYRRKLGKRMLDFIWEKIIQSLSLTMLDIIKMKNRNSLQKHIILLNLK